MSSESAVCVPGVNREALQRADYQFQTPFIIELPQGEFYAEEIVRLIPGRRMVAFGSWRGVPAVAKIFYHPKNAAKHLAADLAGVRIMQENKIPTPQVLFEGAALDAGIQIVVFERIHPAADLESLWMARESDESILPLLQAVMVEMATQHVLGITQRDMHLGNFLVTGKVIYTLDGAQIEKQPELLAKKESMENLALLLSQLGAGVEALQHALFLHYARARSWLLKPADTREMQFLIRKYDVDRWRRYEKKIFRSSTDFVKLNRFTSRSMVRRRYLETEMRDFLKSPDTVFSSPDAVMLKNGRSSTVIKTMLDGRTLVIKRYNMKNIWHRLRRMFRATRARHSWRLAQKLRLFNVNTPIPVAFLESNILGMRGKSYFVMEYVSGSDVKEYLSQFEREPYAAANVIKRVCNLLASLTQLEVTHGDLKASNIIIAEDGQPYLIDLDGAAEHYTLTGLQKAWRLEMKRFMRNFEELPSISEILRRSIRADHLK